MKTLQDIPIGAMYRIVQVTGTCVTAQRIRELGMIPGASCTVVRKAPFGGPMEISLERRSIGVRLEKGLTVLVEPIDSPSAVVPTPAFNADASAEDPAVAGIVAGIVNEKAADAVADVVLLDSASQQPADTLAA